jgi:hypothetical protein
VTDAQAIRFLALAEASDSVATGVEFPKSPVLFFGAVPPRDNLGQANSPWSSLIAATLQRVVFFMAYTDTQLAKELGVDRTTAWRWRKEGCPNDDLEAARAFAQNRKPKKVDPSHDASTSPEVMQTVVGDKTLTIPAGEKTETAYDVRDRLQAQERSISGEITGLNTALEQARAANDEKQAYKLLQALKSAREEHRRQADSLLKAEGRIIILERNRGDLVSIEVCKTFISRTIVPLTIWLRKLPDIGRNPEEKGLLETLREAGLAVLRDSAAEAANFTGKEVMA